MNLLLITLIAIVLFCIYVHFKAKSLRDPRIPHRFPLLDFFGINYFGMEKYLTRQHKKYGNSFYCHRLSEPMLITTDPHFVTLFHSNNSRPEQLFKSLVNMGLLTSNGESWKLRRSIISPVFQISSLKNVFPDVVGVVDTLLDKWSKLDEIEVVEEMKRLTLEVIGVSAFGILFNGVNSEESHPALSMIEGMLELVNNIFTLKLGKVVMNYGKYKKMVGEARKFAADVINKKMEMVNRGEVKERKDLLDSLLEERVKDGKLLLSDADVVDEALLFFIAGSETTSNSLAFTLYTLAHFQELQEQVYQKIYEAYGDRNPTFDDLSKVPLLNNVISESMRFYPVVNRMIRVLDKDTDIEGFHLKKDSMIMFNMRDYNFREEIWENPHEFRPERFEGDHEDRVYPFGTGRRVCVGKSLANLELHLIIAKILQKFKLTPKVDIWPLPYITVLTNQPLPTLLKLERR